MDEYTSLHRRDLSQTTLTEATHPTHVASATYDDHDTIGECIAPRPSFQFQRRSTTASGETLLHSGTHTRQQSRDSGLFAATSLDSDAATICATDDGEAEGRAQTAKLAGIPGPEIKTHRIALVDSHRIVDVLRKCSRSVKLARSIKRVCLYRSKQSLPPPVVYEEPQYSLVGDIKTVRFDDCVVTPAAPCTDWDDVECQGVLVVGRDPILPPSEPNRSSIVGGLRESRYGLNRLSQSFK